MMSHNSKEDPIELPKSSECTPEQLTEIDKLKLVAEIPKNHMKNLMTQLAIEARNPVKQASDTIRTVHDLPTISMPFLSLLPTKTNKASQFALNSYLYNAKTTMIMLVYPVIIEAVKVRLYTTAIKYEQAFVEINKTMGPLLHILDTEATFNDVHGDMKMGIYKVNEKNYRQIENVWVHTNVFNDGTPSTITPRTEKEVKRIDESEQLNLLLDDLLNAKNVYCILTGRHALWSEYKPGIDAEDWVAQSKKEIYKYDHENESYKVHVREMFMSLQKLPAGMLLVSEKIGPLFEAYIPLFLERRIVHQPSQETALLGEQYGNMWNMACDWVNEFFTHVLDNEKTIVVDFHTRHLDCDIEFSKSLDTLIEDTRRFMHIRQMLLGKIAMLSGPIHNMGFTGSAGSDVYIAQPFVGGAHLVNASND